MNPQLVVKGGPNSAAGPQAQRATSPNWGRSEGSGMELFKKMETE